MWSQTRVRVFLTGFVVPACTSVGCMSPHFFPYPPYPGYPAYYQPPPVAPAPPASKEPPKDTVVRGQYEPVTDPYSVPGAPGQTIPQPMTSAAPPPQAPQPQRSMNGLHDLMKPTVTGEKWALAPNEVPNDRAVELQRRFNELATENQKLQARIDNLETNGRARENSLNQVLIDVRNATQQVITSREDVKALRADLVSLRDRVKQAEDRELATLNQVIDALQQLLDDE